MPFAIETWDQADGQSIRAEHRAAHQAYLAENASRIIACGAKLTEDGSRPNGAILLMDFETREEAEAFLAGDPFTKAGLQERYTISRWRKAYLDGKSYLPKS